VGDDSVFKKDGQQLGMVGIWYSSQEHRIRRGINGLLLLVVIGEGKLLIPVDFSVRRPDPMGPGRSCRDKLTWLQVMLVGPILPCSGWDWHRQPLWSWPIVGLTIRSCWRT
jgi:hypothetical protein